MANLKCNVTIMTWNGTSTTKEMTYAEAESFVHFDAPNDGRIKFVAVATGTSYLFDWDARR